MSDETPDVHPGPSPYNWETEEYVHVPDEEPCAILQVIFDTGLLLQINSAVLHPHGLAMGVEVEEGKVTGLNLHRTDDPEGLWFDEDLTKRGRERAVHYGLTLSPVQRGCKVVED